MRMGGARAHQRSSPGRGADAPRSRQGIGAIDVQTTLGDGCSTSAGLVFRVNGVNISTGWWYG